MTLSVIIPVYNVKHYLQSCIDSVLMQTYSDMQIILVDDGSTDGSAKLCDEIKKRDSRICVIHKTNGGLSDARNAGLRQAQGEYVVFLDADDVWLQKNGIEKMVDCLNHKPTDLLLFKRVDLYPSHKTYEKDYDAQYINTHTVQQVFENLVLTQRFNMSACFQLVSKEFLIKNDLWFPIGMLSEDVDWSLRLWQKVKSVQALNIDMYGYQHRQGSITTTYSIKNLECYDVMFQIWRDNINKKEYTNKKAIGAYLANLYVSCIYSYKLIDPQQRNKAREIIHRNVDLLNYANAPKAIRAKKLYNYCGEWGMCFLLSSYAALKRLIKK